MEHISEEVGRVVREIKPIPTVYDGVQYRSRLEARWAVFFDAARIGYRYEDEGYELPSGRYLPDFWLPDLGVFVEVKPSEDHPERERTHRLCSELSRVADVYLAGGPPFGDFGPRGLEKFSNGGWYDCYYNFCECCVCSKLGITFDGRGARVCKDCECAQHGGQYHGDKCYTSDRPRFLNACERARTQRFWR